MKKNTFEEFKTIDIFGNPKGLTTTYTAQFAYTILTFTEEEIDEAKKKYSYAKFKKWTSSTEMERYIRDFTNTNKTRLDQLSKTKQNLMDKGTEYSFHTYNFERKGKYTSVLMTKFRGENIHTESFIFRQMEFKLEKGHHHAFYGVAMAVLKAKALGLDKFAIFTNSLKVVSEIESPSQKETFTTGFNQWFAEETKGKEVEVHYIKKNKEAVDSPSVAKTSGNYKLFLRSDFTVNDSFDYLEEFRFIPAMIEK